MVTARITVADAAQRTGLTEARVRQIIQEWPKQPQRLGRMIVLSKAEMRKIEKRNKKPGPQQ